jgi:hypothetical protein
VAAVSGGLKLLQVVNCLGWFKTECRVRKNAQNLVVTKVVGVAEHGNDEELAQVGMAV